MRCLHSSEVSTSSPVAWFDVLGSFGTLRRCVWLELKMIGKQSTSCFNVPIRLWKSFLSQCMTDGPSTDSQTVLRGLGGNLDWYSTHVRLEPSWGGERYVRGLIEDVEGCLTHLMQTTLDLPSKLCKSPAPNPHPKWVLIIWEMWR